MLCFYFYLLLICCLYYGNFANERKQKFFISDKGLCCLQIYNSIYSNKKTMCKLLWNSWHFNVNKYKSISNICINKIYFFTSVNFLALNPNLVVWPLLKELVYKMSHILQGINILYYGLEDLYSIVFSLFLWILFKVIYIVFINYSIRY